MPQYARDPGRVCRSTQDEREFVAAEPDDQAGIVEGPTQTPRDLAQACVSGRMAERIVELFETIEVDQDKCRRETMIQAVADNLAIARLENGAIGESSERIGFGLPPQVLHGLAVGGDVLFGAEDPRPPSVLIKRRIQRLSPRQVLISVSSDAARPLRITSARASSMLRRDSSI